MVTVDDVRRVARRLPRSSEHLIHDRVKFRVGKIVYVAFSRDETVMGFAFPKEEREALVRSDPTIFHLPGATDMRFHWVHAWMAALDETLMEELVVDAWRLVVPKKVSAAYVAGRPDADQRGPEARRKSQEARRRSGSATGLPERNGIPDMTGGFASVRDRVLARHPGDEEGRMLRAPALKTAGKVYAFAAGTDVVVKLPASRVADLIEHGRGVPCSPRPGRPMKEWVRIAEPDEETCWSVVLEARSFVAGSGG